MGSVHSQQGQLHNWAMPVRVQEALQGGEAVPGHSVQAGATRSRQVWALWSNASGGAGV